jgi:hypothetical protein
MKNLKILVAGVAGFSLASFPAFACNLWAPFLDCAVAVQAVPQPHAAPAPMLAAGLPAFLALGGGFLATKVLPRLRGGMG